jgi:hypothetical protein
MSVTITIDKADGWTNTFVQDWDDATVERLIAWAKASHLNDDGTQPGDHAACNRVSKDVVQLWRDEIKRWEFNADVAAIPPPEDIPIDALAAEK